MKTKRIKQIHAYKIDLTKVSGKGDFVCPQCGAEISPDDCSKEVYSILDIMVEPYGLSEVIICCNKCTSQIHLTGFSSLPENEECTRKNQSPHYEYTKID
jgi:predicted RNA-binding Zn-ribbon protein involved in translation (DUF1610 family)